MRPTSPPALVEAIADQIMQVAQRIGSWVRVGIDGADAAHPSELADALVDPLRVRGRAAIRARTEDHLRPASLRFERGRTDPDSFYEDWFDLDGLRRELLLPLRPGGDGMVRTVRWDAAADRASRVGFAPVPPGGVLLLSGPLLLGRGLPLDLTVHLDLSAGALVRRTPLELAWTLPAYERYAAAARPAAQADIVVRADDARHPAVRMR
jgi:hypothetical protein